MLIEDSLIFSEVAKIDLQQGISAWRLHDEEWIKAVLAIDSAE